MPTIALRFPAGRYHATPWGSHVNEGAVEWPPSPWRLARALLATGFTKLGWTEVPAEAASLVDGIASAPPRYRLPAGTVAHTRHYMPIRSGRSEKKTKVLDTFVRLDRDAELQIELPVELAGPELELLERLVSALGYLGRAESWVEGWVLAEPDAGGAWCEPAGEATVGLASPGTDHVTLPVPATAEAYAAQRADAVARVLEDFERQRGTKPTAAQRRRLTAPYPEDLIGCLLAETAELQKHGWSEPPGSRPLLYVRPADALRPRPPRPTPRGPRVAPVEAALLALASDTPRGDVLPLFTRSLPQAELLHQAVISMLGEEAPGCPALTGRDARTGAPLGGRHRHAQYVPLDLDQDGRLDHVLLHAPMGLDQRAQRAISRVQRTWTKGSDQDLIVTCAGFGSVAEFAEQLRLRSGAPVPALGTSAHWASISPFVPPRHLRARGHTLEDQVRAELESRGFPEPVEVIAMSREELVSRSLLRFVRSRRRGKPQPPAARAFGLHLRFARPVAGPLALGYASHYGLGLFGAEEDGGTT